MLRNYTNEELAIAQTDINVVHIDKRKYGY